MKRNLVLFFCFAQLCFPAQAQLPEDFEPEMRAVWITSLLHMDFPRETESRKQREAFLFLLDSLEALNINTLIVQIRPEVGAFYPAAKEPWSRWITRKSGKTPQPFYDPLGFMLEATHKRGMEFHAWVNPFRAAFDSSSLHSDYQKLRAKNPDWFFNYGGQVYLNPGAEGARKHLVGVIRELVERYDIDALHLDDYFYPYPEYGALPDVAFFEKQATEFTEIKSWRRHNTASFMRELHQSVKAVKPFLRIGVSPFGVWRNRSTDPKGSRSQAYYTCYDDLYADVLHWMQEGWIDYLMPQLYHSRKHDKVPFAALLHWWVQNTPKEVQLYVGHAAYRVGTNHDLAWLNPDELPAQIRLVKSYKRVSGSAFFRLRSLLELRLGVSDSLKSKIYAEKAFSLSWKKNTQKPKTLYDAEALSSEKGVFLRWDLPRSFGATTAARWVLFFRGTSPNPEDAKFVGQAWAQRGYFLDKNAPRGKALHYFLYPCNTYGTIGNYIAPQPVKRKNNKGFFERLFGGQ